MVYAGQTAATGALREEKEMGLLKGKVAIVSGIGPGLGRATALKLAEAGANVVLAARTEARLAEVADEVRALGVQALAVPTDLAEPQDCEALVEKSIAEFGRVDVLVNNAFMMPPFRRLDEYNVAKIQQSFEVNLFAPLRLSQAVIPHMRAAGEGSIVMIGSVILRKQTVNYGPYKVAKHALLGLTRSLAAENGPDGIRVNMVAPGYIGAAVVGLVAQMDAAARGIPEAQARQSILDTLMLRRAAEPEEIADAILFFASGMSRSITAQCLDVTAGEFAH